MGKLLETLQNGLPGMLILSVREWHNAQGEMGIYHEMITDEELRGQAGRWGQAECYALAVLLPDGRLFHEELTHAHMSVLIEGGSILATFAGAQEDSSIPAGRSTSKKELL